jgi:hypothetical protein
MKTRSGCTTSLPTSQSSRPSVDEDFAPSVTPISPNMNFTGRHAGVERRIAILEAGIERLQDATNLTSKPCKSSLKSTTSRCVSNTESGKNSRNDGPAVSFYSRTFSKSRIRKPRGIAKPGGNLRTLQDLKSPRSPRDRRASGPCQAVGTACRGLMRLQHGEHQPICCQPSV